MTIRKYSNYRSSYWCRPIEYVIDSKAFYVIERYRTPIEANMLHLCISIVTDNRMSYHFITNYKGFDSEGVGTTDYIDL